MATIRSCRPDEIPDVLALLAASRSAAPSVPDTRDAVHRLMTTDSDALLVAELDGRILGTLIAASDGWRGNMYRLTVDPRHRRLGIALRLIVVGEARLRERGVGRVTALVDDDDRVATRAWEAAGYGRDPRIARFVKNLE